MQTVIGPRQETLDLKSTEIHSVLVRIFLRYKNQNSNLSLRSFANILNLSPATLSLVLSGKRAPSVQVLEKFFSLEILESERRLIRKALSSIRRFDSDIEADRNFEELRLEQFEMLASPEHFSILTLLRSKRIKFDMAGVAEHLGLDLFFTTLAINRLKRLGLLKINPNGEIELLSKPKTTPANVPSVAIQSYHRSKLNRGLAALVNTPVAERDFSSVSLLVDVSRMAELQAEVERMRRSLFKKFDTPLGNRVFDLNIQLVPVSKTIQDS